MTSIFCLFRVRGLSAHSAEDIVVFLQITTLQYQKQAATVTHSFNSILHLGIIAYFPHHH